MLTYSGAGVVNTLINKLPFELHLPGYQFCGPGTKLKKRLERGDTGVNPLDEYCKDHDIAYSQSDSLKDRHKADQVLENRAWERVKSKNARFGEKSAAWLATTTMKAKRKLGMGLSFRRNILQKITKNWKPHPTNFKKSSASALRAAMMALSQAEGRKSIRIPRIIPFEAKSGGILPLIPIFAALSALGSLAGGASAIAKTVIDAKNAKKKLEEDQRHNKAMKHLGSGVYLRKTPRGFGLFLKKQ
ncbi:uncharacterized protein isoform X2 [Leptinotarsa decemlineata]|uniref:uncharacterized protein isoform X2 n=1 Tax=Leptinotarsa decemlineata TaxID=7539 RepID=UPI003D30BD90